MRFAVEDSHYLPVVSALQITRYAGVNMEQGAGIEPARRAFQVRIRVCVSVRLIGCVSPSTPPLHRPSFRPVKRSSTFTAGHGRILWRNISVKDPLHASMRRLHYHNSLLQINPNTHNHKSAESTAAHIPATCADMIMTLHFSML